VITFFRRVAPGLVLLLTCAAAAAAQADDLAVRSRTASRAMSEGRFDEAAGIYRDLLRARPDDPRLLMNLGMALAMGGREADALPALHRAIERDPSLVPAHLFLGSSYLAVGEPAKAIAPLERVVAARPTDVEQRRMLASAYAAVGRHTDAVTHLRRASELAPKSPAAWYALGHAYNAVAQEAMGTFDAAGAGEPWSQLLVADALLADGRFADAFAMYREVHERLPTMASIHDAIARIYAGTGHPDWAATERARGALTPADCRRRVALCEFRAGRYRAALVAALKANDLESRYWRARAATELARAAFGRLEQLPDSRERREVRGTLAMAERRYAEAVAELEVALKFAPRDPTLLDDLGTAHYSARDYERALAVLRPLLDANPDDPRLLTICGDSLLQLQRLDEAVTLLRRAVTKSPDDPMPRLTLGRAYVQKGDFAAAIPLIEPQLAADRDGSLHVQLARAYAGIGEREKADALLARSQQLQLAAQQRDVAAGQRTITPPK
jgi:predicted Zn-dependent protease